MQFVHSHTFVNNKVYKTHNKDICLPLHSYNFNIMNAFYFYCNFNVLSCWNYLNTIAAVYKSCESVNLYQKEIFTNDVMEI